MLSASGSTSGGSRLRSPTSTHGPGRVIRRCSASPTCSRATAGPQREVGRAHRPALAAPPRRRRTRARGARPRPRGLDDLALHHLAAHHQRVGLTARRTRAWPAPHTSSPSNASLSSCALIGEAGAPAPMVELLEAPDIGGRPRAGVRRPDGAPGRPTGSGTPCWRFALADPHQRSLALAGQTAAMTARFSVASPGGPRPADRRRHLRSRRRARGHPQAARARGGQAGPRPRLRRRPQRHRAGQARCQGDRRRRVVRPGGRRPRRL